VAFSIAFHMPPTQRDDETRRSRGERMQLQNEMMRRRDAMRRRRDKMIMLGVDAIVRDA
jgi:hypothetical protein